MYQNIFALICLGFIGLTGCAALSKEEAPQPEPTEALVEVLYATDRNITGKAEAKKFYGNERGDMSYGNCVVAIDINKSKTEFADYSVWQLGFENKPDRYTELRKITPLGKTEFFSEFNQRINSSNDESALIYIHGYYRTFEIAAQTIASLVYKINYQGTPVMFSWPSRYELSAYLGDTTSIDWATEHLRNFLENVAQKTKVKTIHVIAHSLGNRGFINAFVELLNDPAIQGDWKFGEIVLMAPDFDRQIFERDIAPVITKTSSTISLYVSAVDVPLWASKTLNLYPRLGDASEDPVIIDGIQTIDASQVSNLVTGHIYYRESPQVMADLYYLINQRKQAEQRPTLKTIETANGQYWEIKQPTKESEISE